MPTSHPNRPISHTMPPNIKRDWDALTAMINEIGNHRHFPLTEDEKKCTYCPYRSYCNRGGKAGRLDESEAGEEEIAI